jgi:hypothetical protein
MIFYKSLEEIIVFCPIPLFFESKKMCDAKVLGIRNPPSLSPFKRPNHKNLPQGKTWIFR